MKPTSLKELSLNPKPHSANPHQHAPGLGPSDRRLGRCSVGLSKQGWVYRVWHTGIWLRLEFLFPADETETSVTKVAWANRSPQPQELFAIILSLIRWHLMVSQTIHNFVCYCVWGTAFQSSRQNPKAPNARSPKAGGLFLLRRAEELRCLAQQTEFALNCSSFSWITLSRVSGFGFRDPSHNIR